jgi:hypothetical protein
VNTCVGVSACVCVQVCRVGSALRSPLCGCDLVRPHNWVSFLRRYVGEAFPEHKNLLALAEEGADEIDDYRGYDTLTVVERVKLLHHLCVGRVAGVQDYVPPDMVPKVSSTLHLALSASPTPLFFDPLPSRLNRSVIHSAKIRGLTG